MIEYVSTRGITGETSNYSNVTLDGLASDGGLYVPTLYPQLTLEHLKGLVGAPYAQLFQQIKQPFIGDSIPVENQVEMAAQAYSREAYPNTQNGNICPVTEVADNLYIQQLSLGPTAAFKDMAMRPLGLEMQYLLGKLERQLLILGATSGDTGPAAEDALKGLQNILLIMLSPDHGMAEFQKAQMGNLSGGNIYNLSVLGHFDDCQSLVKEVMEDPEFRELGAVNSINWARVASQIPYYVSAYLQVMGSNLGDPVDFVVPTGNFGNVLAGYIARKMGLPIRRLIIATNENDILDKLVQTGRYKGAREAIVTSSPSMDITVASNYERVVYDLLDNDPQRVIDYMKRFKADGKVRFQDVGLPNDALLRIGFDSGKSTHPDRLESIQWVHDQSGAIIDPHTADAITIGRQKRDPDVPIICLSTALPVKFEPTIKEALGSVPPREARFQDIGLVARGAFRRVPNDAEVLKEHVRQIALLAA